MDWSGAPCFNTYNNISYRQRSQTLQPIRGCALDELSESAIKSKHYILNKFFDSQISPVDPSIADRANYANVPTIEQEQRDDQLLKHPYHNHHHHHHHSQATQRPQTTNTTPPPPHHQHHHQPSSIHHHQQARLHHHSSSRPSHAHNQHVHSRSHSQHYYHTMLHPVNDLNNYYNLSNVGTTIIPARSRHHSPIHDGPPLAAIHNQVAPQLDCITVMQVCNELGNNIDSSPQMPPSRNYSILPTREGGLLKVMFPQSRMMKGHFFDPITRISVKAGTHISVLGPSKDDRSKFTICYKDQHIDLPHQLTQAPQPTRWNC